MLSIRNNVCMDTLTQFSLDSETSSDRKEEKKSLFQDFKRRNGDHTNS